MRWLAACMCVYDMHSSAVGEETHSAALKLSRISVRLKWNIWRGWTRLIYTRLAAFTWGVKKNEISEVDSNAYPHPRHLMMWSCVTIFQENNFLTEEWHERSAMTEARTQKQQITKRRTYHLIQTGSNEHSIDLSFDQIRAIDRRPLNGR